MPLWGAVEGSEALPKFLTTAQQKDVFANQVVGLWKLVPQ